MDGHQTVSLCPLQFKDDICCLLSYILEDITFKILAIY